jgi:hypothetical protein
MKDNLLNYQLELYKTFSKYCGVPYWQYPIYSKHSHYFEEYFYLNFYKKYALKKYCKLFYIPINWTFTLKFFEWEELLNTLQPLLSNLNPDYCYFTVCMHDNAPIFELPKSTKNFSGGHCCQKSSPMFENLQPLVKNSIINKEDYRENIPIPLIVKKKLNNYLTINPDYTKKYLASFIGSNSHEYRNDLESQYKSNNNFYIQNKNNPDMENIDLNDLNLFLNKSLESYFVLCPRGWGPTSYRLYEAMQLNRVPVYISDIFWLPYENEIDWNSMCVFIKPEQINDLENILNEELKSGNYQKKIKYINEIYDRYFTFEKMFDRIIEHVNCGMP